MAKSPPEALIHAHESWLAAQKRAAEILLSAPQPGTPQDWAEGYRWLTRIGSLVQDWILEKEDPLRPELFRCQGPYRKLIGDNPDVNYYFASLDPSQHYRLSGREVERSMSGSVWGAIFFVAHKVRWGPWPSIIWTNFRHTRMGSWKFFSGRCRMLRQAILEISSRFRQVQRSLLCGRLLATAVQKSQRVCTWKEWASGYQLRERIPT